MISVVIPVYNEEQNVEELHQKISGELTRLKEKYEIIFVDDGSKDCTFEKLKSLKPVKIISFQKNSGQTSAMDAGFRAAQGTVIITMDGDLQNDPEDILRLIEKLNEGYDVVSGWRSNRQDTFGRRILSKLANWLIYKFTGLYLHDYACAIKAYRSAIFQDVHLYGEMHVILPAYLYGRGAKVAEIPVKHHRRKAGISKHSFIKAVKNISDLLTVHFLSQYMGRPLLFFGWVAACVAVLGFISAFISITLKVLELRNFGQTPLPLLTVFFFTIGFLLFMMGFLAELMIRIYWETQQKYPYVIKETLENKES